MKQVLYTHGLSGSLEAQPEIEEVFAPLGYTIIRVEVPFHSSLAELAIKMATMTFGELCLLIHATANKIIDTSKGFHPAEYKEACRRLAKSVKNSKAIMVYNEGRYHPIGKEALRKYAVPFLQNKPLSAADTLRSLFSSGRELLRASLRVR
jgi:hypothetical protein